MENLYFRFKWQICRVKSTNFTKHFFFLHLHFHFLLIQTAKCGSSHRINSHFLFKLLDSSFPPFVLFLKILKLFISKHNNPLNFRLLSSPLQTDPPQFLRKLTIFFFQHFDPFAHLLNFNYILQFLLATFLHFILQLTNLFILFIQQLNKTRTFLLKPLKYCAEYIVNCFHIRIFHYL